jgi:glycosyltransferase involved in cell wall biosynthesis
VTPKISLVSSSAATCFGGAETYVLNAARLLSADCDVHVVSGKGELTDDLKDLLATTGVVFHGLRFIGRRSAFSRSLIRGRLRAKLNEFDVEALSLLWPPRRIKKALEQSDVVEVNYATEGLIFPLLDRGARKIMHFHGPWLPRIYAHLKDKINKSVDLMVTCSRWSKGELEKLFGGKPGVEVIYNGVDTDVFRPVDMRNAAMDEASDTRLPRLGTVGRLGPEKGTDLLMEVARAMQGKAEFFAAGPLDSSLAEKIERKGAPANFHVLGPVPNQALPEFYNSIDCFVLPTLFEAFSITLVEAMASGKAVVASRTGGIPEVVEHNKQGILVQPNDGAALREAIGTVIGDRSLMSDMGEAGRARVLEKFSIKQMGREIRQLFLGAS